MWSAAASSYDPQSNHAGDSQLDLQSVYLAQFHQFTFSSVSLCMTAQDNICSFVSNPAASMSQWTLAAYNAIT